MPGDTFDAGTVYAEARLGRDEFQRDLAQLRRDIAAFERQQFNVNVGLNTNQLDRDAAQATRTVRDVGRQRADPKIGADDRTFMQRMFSVRATLKQIGEIVATPLILVDIAQSLVRVAKLKYELRDMAQQYIVDVIVYPQAFQEINKISNGLLTMQNVARVAIPALGPGLAAVAGQALIIASSFASAGGALGVFALAAVPLLTGLVEKSKEIEDAQRKVTEALTDEQRKTALRELDLLMAGISEQERAAIGDINAIKTAWQQFQVAIQPAVFGVLANSVGLIQKILPQLVPIVNAVAEVLNRWIDSMEAAIDRGGLKRFTDWLAGPGVTNLDAFGRALGNFAGGFVNLLMGANGPALQFSQGLLTMSERFLAWSQTIESNQQFQEWMRFTQAVMPQVLTILGQLLPILMDLHRVFAPITEAVIGFVASFVEAHPTLVRFLVVGYAVSQFFFGLIAIVAGLTLKILLFAAIFGRIAGIMAVGRAAAALWAAVMTGSFSLIIARAGALIAALFRLTAIGRLFTWIMGLTQAWTYIQAAFNAVMALNPVILVVAAILALGAAIIWAYNNVGWFKDAVDAAFKFIGEVATWLWQNAILPAVEGIVAAWTWLVDTARAVGQWIADAWANVISFFQALPGIVGNFLAELPGNIAYWLGFAIGTIVRWAVDAWNAFVEWVPGAIAAVGEFFANLPGQIWSWLVGVVTTLAQVSMDAGKAFLDGIASAFNATVAWFQALPGRIWSFLVSLVTTTKDGATNAWNGFTEGISTAWEATAAWFEALPGNIGSFFVNAWNWLWDFGSAIIAGLWEGIKAAWNGFWSWLGSLWDSFIQGFKDAFGIASPSSVFMQFGQWILEGLLNGLIAFGQMIIDWVVGFGQMVVAGFQAGIDLVVAGWNAFWGGLGAVAQAAADGVMAVVNFVWGIIQGAFQAGADFVSFLWNAFWDGLRVVVDAVFNGISAFINTTLDIIEAVFGVSMETVRAAWNTFWETLRAIAQAIFDAIRVVVETVWNIIQALFQAAMALLRGDWDAFWGYLQAAATLAWGLIQGIIDTAWAIIRTAFGAAIDFIVGIWNAFWDGLRTVAETVFNAIGGVINTVLDAAKTAFNTAVDAIAAAWGKIREIVAAPIRFMVNLVYNQGIVPAWNFVAGLVGLGKLGTVNLAFASGGVMPGYSPGRDNYEFFDPRHGIKLGLGGGEAIMRPEVTKGMGKGWIDALNFAARVGGVQGVRNFMKFGGEKHLDYAYAPGGVVAAQGFARSQAGKPYVWGGVGPGGYDCTGFLSAVANVALGLAPHSRRFATGSFGPGRGAGGFVPGTGSAFVIGVSPDTGSGIGHASGNIGGLGIEARGGDGVVIGGGARSPTSSMFPWQFYLPQVGGIFMDTGGVDIIGELMKLWAKVTEFLNQIGQFMGTLWGQGAMGLVKALTDGVWNKLMSLVGLGEAPPMAETTGNPGEGSGRGGRGGGGTFDQGGLIPPGWNAIYNGTGRPELAGRVDQWASLIDSERVNIGDTGMLDRASLMELNGTMAEVRDLLERRGAGATVIVEGSKSPTESGRAAALRLRLS